MPAAPLLNQVANAFLAGESSVETIADRLAFVLGRRWRFLTPLVERYFSAFSGRPRPRRRGVIRFLLEDAIFQRAWRKRLHKLSIPGWLAAPSPMQPVPAAVTWNLPAIETAGDLAAWLDVSPTELDWFADLKGLTSKLPNPRLSHYHCRLFVKRSGGLRLVEAPKRRLKQIQRTVLSRILDRVPPHSAAHGFIPGRSIHTFIAPHLNRRVVLKMDLRNFFPSVNAARIQSFFRTAGYSETVADLLGGLSTSSLPKRFWNHTPFEANPDEIRECRLLYSRRHLPQGAPTSPALANICAYRLDCRLSGLARAAGATYTRYADDLAFSGDRNFERSVERFSTCVAAVVAEEGFAVHHRKTRIMRSGVRQHLAGLTVNQHGNVNRRDFDLLKATLTNCLRHGPSTQNHSDHPHFRQHLGGRIAFMESVNPSKAARLRALFSQIDWNR